MSDQDDTERPTEGVRIIGAQEAAEAADRADIVRRRRGKRYGDRPDTPAPASDLPKITISTSESDDESGPDRFGAVPVVRPDNPRPDEPRWAPDSPAERDTSFGHARIVSEPAAAADEPTGADLDEAPGHQDEPTQAWSIAESIAADAHPPAGPEPQPQAAPEPPAAPETPAPQTPDPWADEPAGSSEPDAAAGSWSSFDDPTGAAEDVDVAPYTPDASMPWSEEPDEDLDRPPTTAPAGRDEPVFSFDTARGTGDDEGFGESDDSFVLPHWTEPPTGQVPRVVVGEDADEPEPLATYGSQPRWRDQGERSAVDNFDDLADDGPSLGALDSSDHVEDDFFADGPFADAGAIDDDPAGDALDDDYYDDDDYDDDYDDDGAPGAVGAGRRRPRGPSGPAAAGSDGGDRNLVTAVAVGVGLVALALVCFWLGTLTTALLATLVVGAAAFEYYTAVREAGHNPATLLGAVAVAGLMIATAVAGLAAYPVVLGLSVLAGLLWYLWVAPGEGAVANLGLTLLGVLWIGVLGSFSTLFLGLGRVAQDASDLASNPGIGVFLAAAIAAVSHDVGAYFVGKYLGRTPLSATSPNKTQEGLAGGVLASLVVTFVIVGLIGIEPIGGALGEAFIFALLCALVAPLGDLCESLIKRDLGIKDMGSVLPGHGGVLDRFDALLFVLPVAYFVTVLFDTWSSAGA